MSGILKSVAPKLTSIITVLMVLTLRAQATNCITTELYPDFIQASSPSGDIIWNAVAYSQSDHAIYMAGEAQSN
jgi:hypothetical protein